MIPPEINSVWRSKRHVGAMRYVVIGVANTAFQNPDYPPQVVYRGDSGFLWTKPLTEWYDKMVEAPR